MSKIPGSPAAVGYWGRNLRCRIGQEQTLPKIRALLQDQLLGAGLRAALWLSVHDSRDGDVAESGTLKCSCVKASGQHADRRCMSCHGIGYVPGYRKFGYETLWVSSISPGLTLKSVHANTVLKPSRLELDQTATDGSIETGDVFFTRLQPDQLWAWRNECVIKDGVNSSVEVLFSTDGGASWLPATSLTAENPKTGRIRFRIELHRTATDIASPAWEILRARFPIFPIRDRRGPWILALKAISPDKQIGDLRGVQTDASTPFWTAPLSFFDCGVMQQGGIDSTYDDNDAIHDPAFIEFLDGARGLKHVQRWAITSTTVSDPLGYMTRQYFQSRITQQEEFTGLVW